MSKINHQQYQVLIVGGGLFGCYAALFLAKAGKRVLLVEKESRLFQKASVVNQARLHGGYHYPRSVATARMSDENKARFTREHEQFINFSFEKYYAIDRYASMTDAAQFERFCEYIGIRAEAVEDHPLIDTQRLERLYATTEYTFDPIALAQYYREQIHTTDNIDCRLNTQVTQAQASGQQWEIELEDSDGRTIIFAEQVLNATYAASNGINQIFGVAELNLMHEISEMAFVHSPQFAQIGLTIMDGQFASLMPYGQTGMLSLSSVAYTHHKVSYEATPQFDCMDRRVDCRPGAPAICNFCAQQPPSNYLKMLRHIRHYLRDEVQLHYFQSMFTIKSKLRANYIDDGRPTEIGILSDQPRFYCVFAGKINSIYELEKVF